jgi:hypothetical protein
MTTISLDYENFKDKLNLKSFFNFLIRIFLFFIMGIFIFIKSIFETIN